MSGIPDPGHRLLFSSISEYVVRENFFNNMSDQNSTVNNLIRPDELIAVELSNSLGFEDLPNDLQEKVNIARDAANPKKYQPRAIADDLLKQLRSQRVA